MDVESCVPPGFRFHPTEEELVGYYLTRKVNSQNIDLGVIVEIDLYRMEPWDLQDRCKLGYEEQNEWYFFSHKDKKYPTGTRTNRATTAGFWKATGRDKIVLSKDKIIGMRKTLVFYKGRAPNGRKTDWIMHEYRLQTSEHGPPQEEVWVVCRAFKKPIPNQRPGLEPLDHSHFYTNTYDKLLCSSHQLPHQNLYDQSISIDQVTNYEAKQPHFTHLIDLPQLHNPSLTYEPSITANTIEEEPKRKRYGYESQLTDWQSLDNLFFTFNEASNSDLELLPVDCEADVRNHVNGLISSFHTT